MSLHRPSIVNAPHALKPWAGSFKQTTVSSSVVSLFGTTADSTHVYALPSAPTPLQNNALTVPPQEPLYVYLVLETNQIRYTSDGTVPSSTVGFPLNPGQTLLMSLQEAKAFQCIATGSAASIDTQRYDE
jgi:hypothetical protein